MRGQATANLCGRKPISLAALAATAVAVLTDLVFHDKGKLHISFGSSVVIVCHPRGF